MIWSLEKALGFVRRLQPLTRLHGYHMAIGGGVVNNGGSEKDLDLYLLPLDNMPKPADYEGMLMEMEAEFGPSQAIGALGVQSEEYPTVTAWSPYHAKRKFANNGHRVDVFFIKGELA